ncbi:MAG TPA: hypothetical protein VGZ22_03465 [Isosphaeraceae bacterium]|jgi:hypothetical protein|nr:hypothetical protein [Isosphaeraceae bacterium]
MSDLEPAAVRCLERTRSAVLNVLVVVAAGIAGSGIVLGRRDRGVLLWPERTTQRATHAALLLLIVASFMVRRVLGSRSALRDPDTRCVQFYRAHVIGAIVGALAVPLGFAYGWGVRPLLDAVIPFWLTALALGVLALPRAYELADFDAAMSEPSEPRP